MVLDRLVERFHEYQVINAFVRPLARMPFFCQHKHEISARANVSVPTRCVPRHARLHYKLLKGTVLFVKRKPGLAQVCRLFIISDVKDLHIDVVCVQARWTEAQRFCKSIPVLSLDIQVPQLTLSTSSFDKIDLTQYIDYGSTLERSYK